MKHLRFIPIVTLALLTCNCNLNRVAVRAASSSPLLRGTDESALEHGRAMFARGEYALAADSFRKAIRQVGDSADAYNGLAASYDQLGRYDLSRRYYELALAIAPEDGRILRNLARSMSRQGDQLAARKLLAEIANLERGGGRTDAAPANLSSAIPSGQGGITIALDDGTAQSLPSGTDWSAGRLIDAAFTHVIDVMTFQTETPGLTVALDSASPGNAIAVPKLQVVNAVGRNWQASRM